MREPAKYLGLKAFAGMLNLVAILGVAAFLPAGTVHYWQAWVYLLAFFGPVLAITVFFLNHDPALIQRRLQAGPTAEVRPQQKFIQAAASICFVALYVISALDHRFGWSQISSTISLAADIMVMAGLGVVFLVFRENSHTSAVIEIADDQQVISSGPYAVVRHPMYAGAMLMLLATPIALGSWWGMMGVIPMTGVIVLRLLDEETVLRESLPGYLEYCRKVGYRLVPGVW